MPVRVGIDMVSVESVRESIREHGEHYLGRVYTETELRDCQTAQGVDPERLAARFAAKEATLKVLRPDDEAVPWLAIEVQRHSAGWVRLHLSGPAAALSERAGVSALELSLTHEAGFAQAVVIAELDPRKEMTPSVR